MVLALMQVNQCTHALQVPQLPNQTEVNAWVQWLSSSGLPHKRAGWSAKELHGYRLMTLIAAAPQLSSIWHAVKTLELGGVADAAFLQAS
jgi:hypothetical protein